MENKKIEIKDLSSWGQFGVRSGIVCGIVFLISFAYGFLIGISA